MRRHFFCLGYFIVIVCLFIVSCSSLGIHTSPIHPYFDSHAPKMERIEINSVGGFMSPLEEYFLGIKLVEKRNWYSDMNNSDKIDAGRVGGEKNSEYEVTINDTTTYNLSMIKKVKTAGTLLGADLVTGIDGLVTYYTEKNHNVLFTDRKELLHVDLDGTLSQQHLIIGKISLGSLYTLEKYYRVVWSDGWIGNSLQGSVDVPSALLVYKDSELMGYFDIIDSSPTIFLRDNIQNVLTDDDRKVLAIGWILVRNKDFLGRQF